MFIRWLCFLLFLLPLQSCYCDAKERRETFRSLLICDTQSDLGRSVRNDLNHFKSVLKIIARKAKMRLCTTVLDGSDVNFNKIKSLTESLSRTKGVSLFYFTGHGFRLPGKTSPWPRIYFQKEQKSMDPEWIYSSLKQGKARLVILLFDCCNQELIMKSPLSFSFNKIPISPNEPSFAGIKTLFIDSKGMVVMAAAAPGEVAKASLRGSLFTTALLEALSSNTKSSKTSWQNIFEKTAVGCSEFNQHPICYTHLSSKL